MKMIAVFEKGARLRHIGHLDLLRTMQRALRRTDLPLKYSQGFNPHLLISFAAPLSVGMAGQREIMEIPLAAEVLPEVFLQKAGMAMPPDLPCKEAFLVEDTHPAPMALLRAAAFTAVPEAPTALFDFIPAFMAQTAIPAIRKTKTGNKPCDIRPMIFEMNVQDGVLHMTLALCEQATCKPDLLLSSLCEFAGMERPRLMLTRTQLYGEVNGARVPLEQL